MTNEPATIEPSSLIATETVRGPFFDELTVGMRFDRAPAVTLTEGLAASHHAIVGNRLRLALDESLASEVTGGRTISPSLVWDVSIGQSTVVTQQVRANLFYRGLCLRRHPVVGDTLSTVTTVQALRENSSRPGRAPTGLAALHIVTVDQNRQPVLDYWRCAMLPLSPSAQLDRDSAPHDDLEGVGHAPDPEVMAAAVSTWDLNLYREYVPGVHFDDLRVGDSWEPASGDVVSSAPELARLTGNIAAVHHEAGVAGGRRLVYGGHTIGLALHHVTKALPSLATVAGWQGCDHLAPVHEDDVLRSTITIEALRPFPVTGGLADLRVRTDATPPGGEAVAVLDWRVSAVFA